MSFNVPGYTYTKYPQYVMNYKICYIYECDIDDSYLDEFDIIYLLDPETKDVIGYIESDGDKHIIKI